MDRHKKTHAAEHRPVPVCTIRAIDLSGTAFRRRENRYPGFHLKDNCPEKNAADTNRQASANESSRTKSQRNPGGVQIPRARSTPSRHSEMKTRRSLCSCRSYTLGPG